MSGWVAGRESTINLEFNFVGLGCGPGVNFKFVLKKGGEEFEEAETEE